MENRKISLIAVSAVAALAVLMLGQRACDRSGHWPRREETRVYMGAGSWASGEQRKCSALPREDGSIFFLGCASDMQLSDDAVSMTVTFWGRTQRPDRFQALHSESMEGWHWRCEKSGESLTCYAVN